MERKYIDFTSGVGRPELNRQREIVVRTYDLMDTLKATEGERISVALSLLGSAIANVPNEMKTTALDHLLGATVDALKCGFMQDR